MQNVRRITLALLVSSAFRLVLVDPAEAAGPWRAQMVSAETKQPLEGVVVLAWWTKHVRGFGGPSAEYRDSQEVLTDKDGRFTIAPRSFFSLNPLVFFRGPFFAMFKPGYGDFQWQGYRKSLTWPKENQAARGTTVAEIPRLQSVRERREYLQNLGIHILEVPPEKRPLMENAIIEEEKALGFRGRVQGRFSRTSSSGADHG